MIEPLNSLLTPAVMTRVTLALNHVLGAEAVATARLQAHAGRSVRVRLDGWPALLPPPPGLAFRVTPAGLLEWCGADAGEVPDLMLKVDASNPALLLARLAAGERPTVAIEGDAGLAADVDWLVQNLRWDVAGDLEAVLGPVAAEQLARLGSALARGLRAALARLEGLRPAR